MSGAEVFVVLSTVAALISAYHNGSSIVESIKAKRRARKAALTTVQLEESLAKGPTEVVRARDEGIGRYGQTFAAGDDIAITALKNIEVDLLRAIVGYLGRAQEDDTITDFSIVVDTSDLGRKRAVNVLNELYMRIAQAGPIEHLPRLLSSVSADGCPPLSITAPQLASVRNQGPPTLSHSLDTSFQLAQAPGWAASPEIEQRLSPLTAAESEARRGSFFIWGRRKSSNTTKELRRNRGSSRRVDSDNRARSWSDDQEVSSSAPSPDLTQLSLDDPNPWKGETLHESDPKGSIRSTPTSPSINKQSAGNVLELVRKAGQAINKERKQSRTAYESYYGSVARRNSTFIENAGSRNTNVYGGFCKGAFFLQTGLPDMAMKITNQSVSMQGENYCWSCSSKKCAFEGRARKRGKAWFFDDVVMSTTHGLDYRWSLLAKSHISLGKVKGGWRNHGYKCFICSLLEKGNDVHQGAQDFLQHMSSHYGDRVRDTLMEGPLRLHAGTIQSVAYQADFDLILIPVNTDGTAPTVLPATQEERSTPPQQLHDECAEIYETESPVSPTSSEAVVDDSVRDSYVEGNELSPRASTVTTVPSLSWSNSDDANDINPWRN